jgi:isoaspartyl peptidase/L-asparaginase-like protein (Ntn-hydrolase superfamily)
MEHTEETLLVGEDATNFAIEMGFKKQDLHTNKSRLVAAPTHCLQ